MLTFTAEQVAQIINGKIEGDAKIVVSNFGKIEEGKKGDISFLANPKYEQYVYTTQSSILIVNNQLNITQSITPTIIRVKDPYLAFSILLSAYDNMTREKYNGIDKRAVVSDKAKLGKDVYIGANTIIEEGVVIGDRTVIKGNSYVSCNTTIGNDCLVYSGVNIYKGCIIGNNVILHSGCVIGSDGFGFAPNTETGGYNKIPQIGNVLIEDDVEVGANTTIDRAAMGSTILRRGVKLDNLIQIAHNVELGENSALAAQNGIAGSTKIGKNFRSGGQAGAIGHLVIGDNVSLGTKSGILKSVKDNMSVMGNPAIDSKLFLKCNALFKQLPDIVQRIKALEDKEGK